MYSYILMPIFFGPRNLVIVQVHLVIFPLSTGCTDPSLLMTLTILRTTVCFPKVKHATPCLFACTFPVGVVNHMRCQDPSKRKTDYTVLLMFCWQIINRVSFFCIFSFSCGFFCVLGIHTEFLFKLKGLFCLHKYNISSPCGS
jgi:hypothetical protein